MVTISSARITFGYIASTVPRIPTAFYKLTPKFDAVVHTPFVRAYIYGRCVPIVCFRQPTRKHMLVFDLFVHSLCTYCVANDILGCANGMINNVDLHDGF